MWEISNNLQFFSFWFSIIVGVIFCVGYDILRALRKVKHLTDLTVFFQDVLYFIFIGFITFFVLMIFANGEIRGYIIFGIVLGFAACFLTFSKIMLKFLILCFGFIYEVNLKVVNFFNRLIDKLREFLIKNIKKCALLLNNIKNIKKST